MLFREDRFSKREQRQVFSISCARVKTISTEAMSEVVKVVAAMVAILLKLAAAVQ